jgi:hypothetical protein
MLEARTRGEVSRIVIGDAGVKTTTTSIILVKGRQIDPTPIQ